MNSESTPRALGYRWPAEWEPHAATWVAWPHNRQTWPGKFDVIPPHFARFVRTLAEFEPVNILVGGEAVMAEARDCVGDLRNVTLWDIETDDAWCRDHGPTFLAGPPALPPAIVDWQYNAWGGKYPPFDKDDAVPRRIADRLGRRRFAPGIVLEGGAIDGNGCGTILTTPQCLLNPNRNPARTRDQIERCLRDYLGARKVLWLSHGQLAGDDTDGHVDQLARFVGKTTIVVAVEEDRADENYEPLRRHFEQLRSLTDQDDHPLNVVPLPLPRPQHYQSQRLPASYLNFYIANGVVIVPQFDDAGDQVAIDVLQKLFPDRRIRGLPALDIVWGLGAFHCLTQQEPAA